MEEVKYKRLMLDTTEGIAVDMTRTIRISDLLGDAYFRGSDCLARRTRGEFTERAIYLTDKYDWVIGVDSEDVICLIPLTKAEW